MQKKYPESEYDLRSAEQKRAKAWQLDCLKLNPDYIWWGVGEDYMSTKEKLGWRQSLELGTWDDFGPWGLDDYNEVVNFYFFVNRANEDCVSCDGSGYNAETHQISEDFYDFAGTGKRWCDDITQDEVIALVMEGRLRDYTELPCYYDDDLGVWMGWKDGEKIEIEKPEMPSCERVNADRFMHDAINRFILIETRAKRLGVWGYCEVCDGNGYVYTEENCHLGITLWILHPRKGASRGVRINHIDKSQLDEVKEFLRKAAERNADRFAKI